MENTIEEERKEIIKNVVCELLEKMNVSGEVDFVGNQEDEQNLVLNIKTEFSNYLIGQYGINLQALQHIARVLSRKKIEDRVNFILDVNSYRQDKNTSIANLAKSMAEQAISEKRAVVLRPMSPYERRLVHLELSQNDQVKTESIGEGEDRRIIIKPINSV